MSDCNLCFLFVGFQVFYELMLNFPSKPNILFKISIIVFQFRPEDLLLNANEQYGRFCEG
jgi:hypothetical protein